MKKNWMTGFRASLQGRDKGEIDCKDFQYEKKIPTRELGGARDGIKSRWAKNAAGR